MKKVVWITLLLFGLGILVRIYNFPNRVIFTLEQGITLSTTYDYLYHKFSLLGLPSVQRFTSQGTQIYFGPVFNYFLVPFMYVLGTNPITLTITALFTNILTAVVMYVLISKLSGRKVAILATVFFLFDQTMISQSLTLWILNQLPLIGVIGMYLIVKYHKVMPDWVIFVLGGLSGYGLSLEWMFLLTAIPLLIYILFVAKNKTRAMILFTAGGVIPMLPTIIFELRHDWFHIRSLWQYLLDTITNPGQGSLQGYHFLHLYPVMFYLLGYLVNKISARNVLIYILMGLYVTSGIVNGVKIRPAVSTPSLLEYAHVIANDAGPYYNIVYMPKSEYRAYAMRYILTAVEHVPPLPVDAYPSSDELYVITEKERNMDKDIPWEIMVAEMKSREVFFTEPEHGLMIYKYHR